MASSVASFRAVVPCFKLNSHQVNKPSRCRVAVRSSSSSPELSLSSPELVLKEESSDRIGGGSSNGFVGSSLVQDYEQEHELGQRVEKQEQEQEQEQVQGQVNESHGVVLEKLDPLWDDGYGTATVKDFLDQAKEIIKPDGGPPRWFCPLECGRPIKDSPVLFFLPGLDGTGLGLVLHHKALGKVFEVRCLHIPVLDRTSFEGLVKFVEESVRREHAVSPRKPIYLVGDSFGGCLALAVAASIPTIDLVVILANPATSFGQSQLQPLFPLLEALPDGLHATIPYLLSPLLSNPVKMAMVDIDRRLPQRFKLEKLSRNLTGLLPRLLGLAEIIPKGTLVWKLKLLKSAASYANSRLHAVRAEVLLLASDQDNMLPSKDEAERLKNMLKNSRVRVRHFKENGHSVLLEDGINLLTVIKGTFTYRRTRRHDYISDFLPPSMSEYRIGFNEVIGLFRYACSAVLFSTLEDGNIVRGLTGVPTEGPVLYVGYHMLMGMELYSLVEEFLREKNVLVRGVAHPSLFSDSMERSTYEFNISDWLKVFGALPVTGSNLFKMLSSKSHILLYPGGAREAFHYKGEQYKLFWPDQPEFVRMAAKFGATIVPFGSVGEDDLAELVVDYNDMMKIPVVNDRIREQSHEAVNIREGMSGEVANQALYIPGLLPKVPGRVYHLFGKPISTKGRRELLKDKEKANELYLQIKSEVEACMAYLIKKREEDPYRNVVDRVVYKALNSPLHEVPAFDP